MGRIKEYYHDEIIAMQEQEQSKQKDDDYQYREYIKSLSTNKKGNFSIIKRDGFYFITDNKAKVFNKNAKRTIIATANSPKDLFAYASLKRILIYNTPKYSTKI